MARGKCTTLTVSGHCGRGRYGADDTGTWTILLALAITAGICSQPGGVELYTYLYDHWIPLTSAALVNATFQAIFVYVNSFYSGELLDLGGNSGVFFYDVCLHLLKSGISLTGSSSSVDRSTPHGLVFQTLTSRLSTRTDLGSSCGRYSISRVCASSMSSMVESRIQCG